MSAVQERHPMKPYRYALCNSSRVLAEVEDRRRLTLTNNLVVGYGLHKSMDVYQPRPATKEELEMFHGEDYIDFLSRYVLCIVLQTIN